ncbi:MAG: hypothetical protein IPL43_12355 [Micropruina sp.]|nr:hypothetical protein [Micropruina sp.]
MDVFGLPLHPLVVHAAVVLVPLAALGALLVVAFARVRERYGWLVVAFAVAAGASAIVARLSGEALAAQRGLGALVVSHRTWGELTVYPAVALALLLPVGLLLQRRSRTGWRVVAGLSVLAAVAGLVLIGLTGHSGAVAVWGS